MDNSVTNFLILLAILIVYGLFMYLLADNHEAMIHAELTKKGAKEIDIFWVWLDFDKSNQTFDVEYKDAQGINHNTTCKIHVLGSDIYWKDQP